MTSFSANRLEVINFLLLRKTQGFRDSTKWLMVFEWLCCSRRRLPKQGSTRSIMLYS